MKTRSASSKRLSRPSVRVIENKESLQLLQELKTTATTKKPLRKKAQPLPKIKTPFPAMTDSGAIVSAKHDLLAPQNAIAKPFMPVMLPSPEVLAPFRLRHQNQSSNQDLERDYDTSQHYEFKDLSERQRFIADYSLTHRKTIHYLESTELALVYQEQNVLMAPTAILQNAEASKVFGAFTRVDIYVPPRTQLVLGYYKGIIKPFDSTVNLSSFVFDYFDDLVVDADQHRNWIAMLNSAISEKTANVKVRLNEDSREIEYYVDGGKDGAFIPAGTQLLTYYGQKFQHYENKRFLRPEDTWEDSDAIFKRYKSHYQRRPRTVEADFLALFSIDATTLFALPNLTGDVAHPNTRYLAYQPSRRGAPLRFLPQNLQENITPLMMACWRGDEEHLQQLLQRGANINTQSSITGQSPLHVLVRANLATDKKIAILRFLQRHGADLLAQDKDEKSILHWAIIVGDEALVRELVRQKPALLKCLDHQNHDALAQAILSGQVAISQFLLAILTNTSKNTCADNISYYLEKDYDYDAENSETIDVDMTWQSRLGMAFAGFCDQNSGDCVAINTMATLISQAFQPFLFQEPYCDWDFINEIRLIQSRYVMMMPPLGPYQLTVASEMVAVNFTVLSPTDTVKNNKLLTKLTQLQEKTSLLTIETHAPIVAVQQAGHLFELSLKYYQLSEELYCVSALQQTSQIQTALITALTLATRAKENFVQHGASNDLEKIDSHILIYQQSLCWYEHLIAANQNRRFLLITVNKADKSATDMAEAIAQGHAAIDHYRVLLTGDASADQEIHISIRTTQRLIDQCEKQASAMLAIPASNKAPSVKIKKRHEKKSSGDLPSVESRSRKRTLSAEPGGPPGVSVHQAVISYGASSWQALTTWVVGLMPDSYADKVKK